MVVVVVGVVVVVVVVVVVIVVTFDRNGASFSLPPPAEGVAT